MPRRNSKARLAFTLVELILVMALLATIMAVAAPSLARSMRERTLEQEAVRLLALTEYARDEAASQGVPMVVWIDPEARSYGVEAKSGYGANTSRGKEFTLHPDVHFDKGTDPLLTVEFAPDGIPDSSGFTNVRLLDRFDVAMLVEKTEDGLGYEIVKEEGK